MVLGRQEALVVLGFFLRLRRVAVGKVSVEKHGGGDAVQLFIYFVLKKVIEPTTVSKENVKEKIQKNNIQKIINNRNNNNKQFSNSHKPNRKGLVAGVVDLVRHQFHAGHLPPGASIGALRHALREALFAAQRLVGFHGLHHLPHLGHGLVVLGQMRRLAFCCHDV